MLFLVVELMLMVSIKNRVMLAEPYLQALEQLLVVVLVLGEVLQLVLH